MRRISVLLALVFGPSVLGQPARYADTIKRLETAIERERVDAGIPGLSVAVVDDQSVIWARGFGHANLARTRLIDADTVHRVGSVSKLFTHVAVMQLVEEGKLDLDASVTTYLPDFKPDNRFGKPLTLRQLMAHHSGLVREPPVGNYFDPDQPSLEKTVASLNRVPLVYEPETKTKYSNAAIAVVGRVVESVDGRPFARAIRERVLTPLGMTASDFEATPSVKQKLSEALMWTYHGREFPAPTFELGAGPAGCLYSSATDLARFTGALFAGGKPILKEASLQQMLKPQFAKAGAREGFGLGFMLGDLDGRRRVGHGGAIYGFSTEMALLPDEKLGVIVIANKDVANRVTTRIADYVLRSLLAVKAGKPMPAYPQATSLNRDLARRLAGRYGDRQAHELIEAGGRLYHLAPSGGFVAEVRAAGTDLVLHGILGNGTRLKCDGRSLTINGETLSRQKDAGGLPNEPPNHFRDLIGEYGWDHNTLFILEKDGRLHALIEWVFLYPLEEESKDVYCFPSEGGLYHGEKLVFKRDAAGKANQVEAARVTFQRRVLDGEDGRTFRITPVKPVEELRKLAMAARPPDETGEFRKADLVELSSLDPTIKVELRYASDNNFLGTPLYPKTAKAYLQRPAAEALVRVHKSLATRGYGLWVFDPYRPWFVTKMFWDATPEKFHNFVADPSKGSRHNRGCAVDLTLYDLKSGKPVKMVSGYDEFSDRAYPNYWGGTSQERWHRELLRRAMEDEGFTVYEAEWWHFDYKDWRSYRIGNQNFEELTR